MTAARLGQERQRALLAFIRRVHPDAELREVRPLAGGTSAAVLRLGFFAEGREQSLVYRQPADAAFEFYVMARLAARGLLVPAPLMLEPASTRWGPAGMLLPLVPGQEHVPSEAVGPAMQSAAAVLARIHAVDWRHPDFPRLPESWPLGRGDAPDAVLLHGDYWPGNWLWSEGQLPWVLDWEDAHVGDRREDVANTRMEVWIRFGAAAAAAFTDAYLAAARVAQLPGLAACDAWAAARGQARVPRWTADPRERGRLAAAIGEFAAWAGSPGR